MVKNTMYKKKFLSTEVILPNLSEQIYDFSAVKGFPRIYVPLYKPISFYLKFRRITVRAKLSLGAISAINNSTIVNFAPFSIYFNQQNGL